MSTESNKKLVEIPVATNLFAGYVCRILYLRAYSVNGTMGNFYRRINTHYKSKRISFFIFLSYLFFCFVIRFVSLLQFIFIADSFVCYFVPIKRKSHILWHKIRIRNPVHVYWLRLSIELFIPLWKIVIHCCWHRLGITSLITRNMKHRIDINALMSLPFQNCVDRRLHFLYKKKRISIDISYISFMV